MSRGMVIICGGSAIFAGFRRHIPPGDPRTARTTSSRPWSMLSLPAWPGEQTASAGEEARGLRPGVVVEHCGTACSRRPVNLELLCMATGKGINCFCRGALGTGSAVETDDVFGDRLVESPGKPPQALLQALGRAHEPVAVQSLAPVVTDRLQVLGKMTRTGMEVGVEVSRGKAGIGLRSVFLLKKVIRNGRLDRIAQKSDHLPAAVGECSGVALAQPIARAVEVAADHLLRPDVVEVE